MWTPFIASLVAALLGGATLLTPDQPKVLEGGLRSSRAVLVALHGGSRRFKSSEELARALLNELDAPARRVGVRILVPVLPDEARGWRGETQGPQGVTVHDGSVPWISPPGEQAVRDLVTRAVERERADPERVGLAGHGAGGSAAILLAARDPQRFSGLVLWSTSPAPYWDAQQRVNGLVEEPVPRLRGLGLYLWTGEDDEQLDRPAVALLLDGWAAEVKRAGGRSAIHEHGEGGHGFGKQGVRRGLKAFKAWRGHGGSKVGGRERR
ncbi:MAG: hypothetical protein DHS20C15_07740 [Planctomycetota bacterium]|nr:MAG: hypothetical protein DHS20C15_07740 [Planctomycetota bacterium]